MAYIKKNDYIRIYGLDAWKKYARVRNLKHSEYYQANREAINEKHKQYYREHREKLISYQQERYKRLRAEGIL